MIERLMGGVLAAYDDQLAGEPAVNQVRALQLLFDLKFLASVLMSFTHDDSAEVTYAAHFLDSLQPSKPQVRDTSQCQQRKTEQLQSATCRGKLVKFGSEFL